MQRPLCPVCEQRHYTHEPHVFGESPTGASTNKSQLSTASTNTVMQEPAVSTNSPVQLSENLGELVGATARQARWRERHREQYNEYQRGLMQRRRAQGV